MTPLRRGLLNQRMSVSGKMHDRNRLAAMYRTMRKTKGSKRTRIAVRAAYRNFKMLG